MDPIIADLNWCFLVRILYKNYYFLVEKPHYFPIYLPTLDLKLNLSIYPPYFYSQMNRIISYDDFLYHEDSVSKYFSLNSSSEEFE